MKVAEVETFVVTNPPPSHGGRYFVFVVVRTDDGIEGVGEAYGASAGPETLAALIEEVADQHLVGRSPFDIELFWRRAYGRGFTLRPDVTLMAAVSALEIACWDINGKALDQPVHNLLGGRVHDRLRTYTYLYPPGGAAAGDDEAAVYSDPAVAAEVAAAALAQGFTAVKLDPAGPYTVMGGHQPRAHQIDHAVAMVAAIREAVGGRADILFGTHGQFTASGAARLAAKLEPFDPLWFEEPVPPDDEAGMARVVASTTIPIASGERLTTKAEFARLLRAGVDIVQPNLGRAGGLLEGKKIAGMAEAAGAQIAPHLYCGPVIAAANAQLGACSPNFLILEAIGDFSQGAHAALLRTPLAWSDGSLEISDAPGLGIEFDKDAARALRHDTGGLHLSMWEQPIDEALNATSRHDGRDEGN